MSERVAEAARDLLGPPNVAVVATLLDDGAVHLTPVWVGHEDGLPTFNTARARLKARHLARDPRVTMTIVDRNDSERYLQVRGRAEVTEEGALEHCEALSQAYTGGPFRPLGPNEVRVVVRVRPEHVEYRLPGD